MYLLAIAGGIGVLLGVALGFFAIRKGIQRVEYEGTFLPVEAQVTGMERRVRLVMWHVIIPVGFVFEYRVQVRYTTPRGEEVTASLPYALGISGEVRAARRAISHHEPLELLYDPQEPTVCHYGSKTVFHIREALYQLLVAGIMMAIGAWLIWWQEHI